MKVHQNENNNERVRTKRTKMCRDWLLSRTSSLVIIMQNPLFSLLHKQQRYTGNHIVNRHSVKFFIRICVGLALAHIIGQRFRPSNAAPSVTKSNWKYRPQKIQTTALTDGKFTLARDCIFHLFMNTGREYNKKRISFSFDSSLQINTLFAWTISHQISVFFL